jgi:DNA-binding SARP family transcriptional activator
VLALLLVRRNETVPMSTIVDELWGERPPPTVAKAVQLYVSRLRKLLGPGVIETQATGYVVRLEPDALDAECFERLLELGRARLGAGAPAGGRDVLAAALRLWRGPALLDFGEEPFARCEARRLEELRLVAPELRLQAELALGGHAAAVPELEGLVHEHPLREPP